MLERSSKGTSTCAVALPRSRTEYEVCAVPGCGGASSVTVHVNIQDDGLDLGADGLLCSRHFAALRSSVLGPFTVVGEEDGYAWPPEFERELIRRTLRVAPDGEGLPTIPRQRQPAG